MITTVMIAMTTTSSNDYYMITKVMIAMITTPSNDYYSNDCYDYYIQ